jgi:hypothetical protein
MMSGWRYDKALLAERSRDSSEPSLWLLGLVAATSTTLAALAFWRLVG